MSEQENGKNQRNFYQKVLTSFKSEEYTEDEVAQKRVIGSNMRKNQRKSNIQTISLIIFLQVFGSAYLLL
ncbi:hypothetical protein GCM10025857_59600 [Alicyclobacillus contaminans]|uniref:Uncharacterized protein n=1 Tax=Tetragenococcus osmophilus TaxID=526944 RepID=A0AA38CYJ9_9ENTE|nr:hypothetical protein [Tetragenococcus osmophilus]GMA54603.1 hypothetical protein GCM10025857_59600 [Alicyclobacillus contaminans]GMA71562.1 hypothetical protein GCM10025885_06110 [Tetragenococcus osmophilus]